MENRSLGSYSDTLQWLAEAGQRGHRLVSVAKLHRAHLFAYLHKTQASWGDLPAIVRDFELRAAYQIIDEIP
jgi:hypothetical protein